MDKILSMATTVTLPKFLLDHWQLDLVSMPILIAECVCVGCERFPNCCEIFKEMLLAVK